MPDNKINERLLRIRIIDQVFSSQPGKTFLPEEIIDCVNSHRSKWAYNRYKLVCDLKFLEIYRNVQLKKETCHSSVRIGRKVTKYGYNRSDASIFNDTLSDDDKLLIKDIIEVFQLKGIDSLAQLVKFEIHYGNDVSKNYSPIISFTKNPDEKKKVSKKLNSLLKTIRDKSDEKCIKIKMKDRFDASKITDHIVHPWYLREYNRRWYLFGLEVTPHGEEIQHYALDRILKITKVAKMPYKKPNISIEEILADVIGINFKKDDVAEDIIFWVSNNSSDFVLSKRMHHTMKPVDIEEVRKLVPIMFLEKLPKKEGVFIKMRCIINYELRREMISFGKELIVLWPNKLRTQVKGIVKNMWANYF